MKTILFAGGGSAGHVTPSIAVADVLRRKLAKDDRILFVVADRADETSMLRESGFGCAVIHAGKFPRGLSIRLLTFPFLFCLSLLESFLIIRKHRPSLLFSKGGFVSVPVCIAAYVARVPIILHSSDRIPNMSDALIGRLARHVCTGWREAAFPRALEAKVRWTGNPVRPVIRSASRDAGRRITGFSGKRPVLMVIGGSQGSLALNRAVAGHFDALLAASDVIHITGTGKGAGKNHARYFARPYVTDDLPHLYALADLIVTRAGAGVLSELSALGKPTVVVPLAGVARDHQVRNAEALAAQDACILLPEERLSELPSVVGFLLASPERMADLGRNLRAAFPLDAAETIAALLLDALRA